MDVSDGGREPGGVAVIEVKGESVWSEEREAHGLVLPCTGEAESFLQIIQTANT